MIIDGHYPCDFVLSLRLVHYVSLVILVLLQIGYYLSILLDAQEFLSLIDDALLLHSQLAFRRGSVMAQGVYPIITCVFLQFMLNIILLHILFIYFIPQHVIFIVLSLFILIHLLLLLVLLQPAQNIRLQTIFQTTQLIVIAQTAQINGFSSFSDGLSDSWQQAIGFCIQKLGHALSIMVVVIKPVLPHVIKLFCMYVGDGLFGAEIAVRAELFFINFLELF